MTLLAVNGTLMRGLELNQRLVEGGAVFHRMTRTAPLYRLWSINDRYPAMLRTGAGGTSIGVELWELDASEVIQILEEEPPGLVLGRILVEEGQQVLGVLAEPYIVEYQVEITHFGGWRAFLGRKGSP
jgi:gamma-glutamylcyclotransferase (GGCT)/AIG2-like uncharacterized protein YtfP